MPSIRRPRPASVARFATCLLVALVVCACSAVPTPGSSGLTSAAPGTPAAGTAGAGPPGAAESPAPSWPAVAGNFDDLPFTLNLPMGWVFGTPRTVGDALADWRAGGADPEALAYLEERLGDTPQLTGQFVAFNLGARLVGSSCPSALSGNTVDVGDGPADVALITLERQNRGGLAELPGIVGVPVSDRLQLPIGETVRIRWQFIPVEPGWATRQASSVGYAFIVGRTAFTFVFSCDSAAIADGEPEFERILGSFALKSPPSPTATPGDTCAAILSHQAPEIEAVLPAEVDGRPQVRWSVRGLCWLEIAGLPPSAIDQLEAAIATATEAERMDLGNLAYGLAGRHDPRRDPPYFIHAALRPDTRSEVELTIVLLFGSAGFRDPLGAADLSRYDQATIAGKQVWVGSQDMLSQDEGRQRPYLFQTEEFMFIVVTDDPTWAADAIGQLP